MKRDDFSKEQQKYLTKTTKRYPAFVPPPLPPRLDLGQLASKLSTAERALGELNGAARRLTNPYILIGPLVRREALVSSAIEGTITTIDNMLLQTVASDVNKDDNAKEANNYVLALNEAEKMLQEQNLPVSHRIIQAAHARLLSGLSGARGAGKRPGAYKTDQNAIGKSGDSEETARYIPPPPRETQTCMDQLEAYINREEDREGLELIELAIVHYQFEAIHPFNDGNGRIGRLLVTLMAKQMNLVSLPLLHISSSIEVGDKKNTYIEKLFRVSTHGEWEAWINFFLDLIRDSCRDAIRMADELIDLQRETKQKALQAKATHRLQTIIDKLFETPVMTISDAQKLCSTSFPTAKSDLEQLVEAGFVTPMKTAYPYLYVAYPVWRIGGRRNSG